MIRRSSYPLGFSVSGSVPAEVAERLRDQYESEAEDEWDSGDYEDEAYSRHVSRAIDDAA